MCSTMSGCVVPSVLYFVIVLTVICSFELCQHVNALGADTDQLNPANFLLWGHGLRKEVVVPARYFYIQVVDNDGNNVTNSVGDGFKISVSDEHGHRARVWVRVIDRRDGIYIIQYKLYNSFSGILLEVLYNQKHVADSPYHIKGLIYQEKCYCPEPSLDVWSANNQCSETIPDQIKHDLATFPKVDMIKAAKEIVQRFNIHRAHSLCHYVIKDNKLYRRTYGEHVGFKMFSDAILLSLTRKVQIPDVEFFVNLGDWPLEKRKLNDNPNPIFSWCGSDDTLDIIMPTYDVTESTLETMGRCDSNESLGMPTYQVDEDKLKNACRVSLDLVSVQGAKTPSWGNKTSKAFWRGRDSRQERIDLVRMSQKYPDIIDAKLTNIFFFKQEKDLETVKHISFFDFFEHKYQINLDGTVAAYRFPYLLAGSSVVFKQDSPYYEHFYKQLQPYVHYIPFKRDLSDLLEKIQWAKDHDEEVQKIAKNGRRFIQENLMAEDIFCYHAQLFQEYSKRLVSATEVREGMELVDQPTDVDSMCDCQRRHDRKEEL